MEIAGFADSGYRLDTVNAEGARAVNLYTATIERGPRAGRPRLRNIPGLPLYKTLATAPLRALWSNATTCYAIGGNSLWQIFDDGVTGSSTNKLIGVLANSNQPATIASNGFQLAIASAGQGFIAPGGGAGVIPILGTDGQPVNASSIVFINQYFVAAIANSKQVRISNLAPAGGIWDPGDTAIKEAYSDNIIRAWVDDPGGQYLWLFGEDTIEIWGSTPDLFPFSRIQGGVFSIGLDAAWSLAGTSGHRFWLWNGIIWWCAGFQPNRVSDYAVEQAIKSYSSFDQNNAEAFAWVDGGHIFYAISFPQAGRTWVYDLKEKAWHERLYFPVGGPYGRYRPRVYTHAFNKHLVGDYATGQIYQMDPSVFTDANGVPLRTQRNIFYVADEMRNVRYNSLTIDMDTGVGLNAAPGTTGFDPQVIMRYSPDRGKTWSNEREATIGRLGDTLRRVTFKQLGSSRIGMGLELVTTHPGLTSYNAAEFDTSPSILPRR